MNRKKPTAPLGASFIVLSSFFYASYGIWTKLMGDFFEGYTASTLRSVLVIFALLPIAVAYKKLQPVNLNRNWPHIMGLLIASLSFGALCITQYYTRA